MDIGLSSPPFQCAIRTVCYFSGAKRGKSIFRSAGQHLAPLAGLVFLLVGGLDLSAQQPTEMPSNLHAVSEPSDGSSLGSSIDTESLAAQNDLPDNPTPQSPPDEPPKHQTKRILGIIPNFRAVSTDEKLPAQSVKEKFVTTTEDSFDYSSAVIPIVLAGYSPETSQPNSEEVPSIDGVRRLSWKAMSTAAL